MTTRIITKGEVRHRCDLPKKRRILRERGITPGTIVECDCGAWYEWGWHYPIMSWLRLR